MITDAVPSAPPTAAEMQAGLDELRRTTTFPPTVYDDMQRQIDAAAQREADAAPREDTR